MVGECSPPLRSARALTVAVLGLGLGLALTPAAPAWAGLIRFGLRQALPRDASVVGRLTATTRLHLSVTLEPRDPAAMAAYAQAVSDPSSVSFHRYLTPGQFARRFGAGAAQVALVRRALRARGLNPGAVSAGHLSIPLTATVAEVQRGLSVSLLKLSLPGRRSAVATSAEPLLDADAARLVQSIVGLDTSSGPHPLLVRPPGRARGALAPAASRHVATGGPQPCSKARSTASGQDAHTADQIASAYGFSGLYGAGDSGAGVTVAIYELEPDTPSDIAAYETCYGIHTSISYVPVDGGSHGPQLGEAALDIENLIGLAPGADVVVYQGPNSNSDAPGSGPYDTFSAIINQDRAQVISVSWGECESALGAGNAMAENNLFEQAAIQGQSIVAASGDTGSEDCDSSTGLPQDQLAVDDPSSQPYVTGVGGTTLTSTGPPPTESAWNSGGDSLAGGLPAPGAGGGGVSDLWAMPADQLDAAPSLNVLAAGQTGSQCGHPGGYCREVPDVSADADPATGYVIYWNGRGRAAGQPSGWQTIGGTSAASPVWAALLALADASNGCATSPVGFANPALYRAASTAYASDFNDVRTGDNDFTGTNGGRFAAGPGYSEATGLGSPNGTALAAGLCALTARLANPGARRSAVGSYASLALHGQDVPGAGLTFRATGLPPGLSLNATTGKISGRPRRTGTFAVAVTAEDSDGSAASIAFTWTVGAPPTLSHASLAGVQSHRPRLSFTVAAGHGSPRLAQMTVTLPTGLKLVSARGVKLSTPGVRRPRFTDQLAHGVLDLTLRRPLSQARITLAYPQLRAVAGRLPRLRHRGAEQTSRLAVRLVDSEASTTTLRSKLSER